jgi:hypothetical protein
MMSEDQLKGLDALVRGLQVYHNNGQLRSVGLAFVDERGAIAINFAGDPECHYVLAGALSQLQYQLCRAAEGWMVSEKPSPKMEPVPNDAANVVPLNFRREDRDE